MKPGPVIGYAILIGFGLLCLYFYFKKPSEEESKPDNRTFAELRLWEKTRLVIVAIFAAVIVGGCVAGVIYSVFDQWSKPSVPGPPPDPDYFPVPPR